MITLSFFIFQCVLQVFSSLFLNFFIPSDKGQEKLSLFQNAQAYCCSQLPFIQFTYPGIKFCLPTACTALLVSEPQRCQICVFLPIVWNIRCVWCLGETVVNTSVCLSLQKDPSLYATRLNIACLFITWTLQCSLGCSFLCLTSFTVLTSKLNSLLYRLYSFPFFILVLFFYFLLFTSFFFTTHYFLSSDSVSYHLSSKDPLSKSFTISVTLFQTLKNSFGFTQVLEPKTEHGALVRLQHRSYLGYRN